ncbi:hypothetical protein NQ317_000132 [Molorchus minor]|uniref:Xenotropic and polytropic retrovirus receptor 1 n=1 Tax=Molorchus minor TaxID=1323400 RepID=A0ABQ9JT31_9CUCU|nr:hypothetical protein NQ317_000132 [Molorchus minor]
MKFAEHLSAHITPEWRKQYINYEEMKAMLYMAVEEAPSAESVEPEVAARHFANFDEQELKKINTFYSEKLAEATRKYANLNSELNDSLEYLKMGKKKEGFGKKHLPARKLQELKLAFRFRKILKKHDKLLNTDLGVKWRQEYVETSHFFTNRDIDKLIHDTENLVTNELELGDRQKAMKRLRNVPPLGEKQSPWTTFKVGLFSGSFVVLLIAVVLSAIFHEGSTDNLKIAFRLYRGPLLIVEFLFLIGVNVYGWRSSGVNHVLIFELDPRNHLSEQHLMELAAIFGVVWALSLLSFIYSASLSMPPYINPLGLVIIMVAFIINPFKVFRHDARFWFLRICGRIFGAPFFHVGFADFWLADQMNSFVSALLDFQFLILHKCMERDFIIRPIVNCIPAWLRFAQCLRRYYDTKEAFPHLVNAGKYSTTFLVVIFATLKSIYKDDYPTSTDNPYVFLWIVAQIVSSSYAYTWDIKMDWGLLDKNAGENTLLREEVVYSSTFFYYFAIIEDFYTTICLGSIPVPNRISSDIMTSILAPLEVFRRFVWNFFRLENEHLNNCGKFRAVRDISIAPIDSSDQIQIMRMMDEDDGVVNRGKRKQGNKKKEEKRPLLHDESIINFKAIPVSTIPSMN